MNWINDNKKQAVFIANIEHWHPGDVYEVIEASIVREKVGELEKELAAAKAETLQFAEWVDRQGYTMAILDNKWYKPFGAKTYTTEELYQQFKQGK